MIQHVGTKKFQELINKFNPNNYILLDVRTPMEYKSGHIPGSLNIDFYDLNFLDKIKTLDKDKPCLIYCRSGHRSAEAATLMERAGFKEIYNLSNGIISWPYNT